MDILIYTMLGLVIGLPLGWLACRWKYWRDMERLGKWSDALHAKQRQVETAEDEVLKARDALAPFAKPNQQKGLSDG